MSGALWRHQLRMSLGSSTGNCTTHAQSTRDAKRCSRRQGTAARSKVESACVLALCMGGEEAAGLARGDAHRSAPARSRALCADFAQAHRDCFCSTVHRRPQTAAAPTSASMQSLPHPPPRLHTATRNSPVPPSLLRSAQQQQRRFTPVCPPSPATSTHVSTTTAGRCGVTCTAAASAIVEARSATSSAAAAGASTASGTSVGDSGAAYSTACAASEIAVHCKAHNGAGRCGGKVQRSVRCRASAEG